MPLHFLLVAGVVLGSAVGLPSSPAALVFEGGRYVAQLREGAPAGIELIGCAEGCDNLPDDVLRRVVAVVGQPRDVALLRRPALERLRLVQSTHFMSPLLEQVPEELTVASYLPDWQHDYGAEPIAEFIMAAIFEWNYRLSAHAKQFSGCAWGLDAPLGCPAVSDMTRHRTLMGQTLGVLGYGTIGQAIARRAAALGMRVVGTKRHGPFSPPPPPLAWLSADNDRLLREADVVVTTVPGTVAGIINTTSLGLMKSDAVLVPISAPHADFQALYAALRQRRIGGAVLDVWPQGCWNFAGMACGAPYGSPAEPYADEPIERLENVLALPGLAMRDDRFWAGSAAFVAGNLAALMSGGPMKGVVRNGTAAAVEQEATMWL